MLDLCRYVIQDTEKSSVLMLMLNQCIVPVRRPSPTKRSARRLRVTKIDYIRDWMEFQWVVSQWGGDPFLAPTKTSNVTSKGCFVRSTAHVCSLHYKMKRHRSASGLCLFGLRSVSVTQKGCAVCVIVVLCQSNSISRHTVFLCVTHLMLFTNDRMTPWQ